MEDSQSLGRIADSQSLGRMADSQSLGRMADSQSLGRMADNQSPITEEPDSGPAPLSPANSRPLSYKILKATSILVVSLLCTLALVLSKGTTVFMVSQLNSSSPSSICSTVPSYCSKFSQTVDTEDSTVAWLWCLVLALLFPDLLTLVKVMSVYTSVDHQNENLNFANGTFIL